MLCWIGKDQSMKMKETSRAIDKKLQVKNNQVCDEDYRNEYIVALYNDSNQVQVIHNGDRIAQLILLPYENLNFVECKELSETERGLGGFGSTGKNQNNICVIVNNVIVT